MVDRQVKTEARLDQVIRRIDSITKLVHTGMKMLVDLEYKVNALIDVQQTTQQALAELAEHQKKLAEQQKKLAEQQVKADKRFEQLMAALLRKNINGRR